MISQFLMFCEEEHVVPLSRATLFRILEVREASQQWPLGGLDNTAAEGSTGFKRFSKIVDDLQQMCQEESWAQEIKKSLQDGKRYFKTGYRNHCQQDTSTCPDYCLEFALGDPNGSDLREQCAHEHTTWCGECNDITICLDKFEHVIKCKGAKFYSKEQEDILYDFSFEDSGICAWRAYVIAKGKLFPYNTLYVQHEGPTMLQTEDNFSNTIIKF